MPNILLGLNFILAQKTIDHYLRTDIFKENVFEVKKYDDVYGGSLNIMNPMQVDQKVAMPSHFGPCATWGDLHFQTIKWQVNANSYY